MEEIWKKKLRLSREIMQDEWLLMQKVNRAQLEWEHFFSVKYSSGILPTKVNMVQCKHEKDSMFPCCKENENIKHILQYKSEMQNETFTAEKKI